jgi:hypothetical protein
MIKYEKITSITGAEFIRRSNDDGSFSDIPVDLANSDYQEYLNPKTDEANEL